MNKQIQKLVEREVKAPATELINALMEQYGDEIAEFASCPNYEAAARENGYTVKQCASVFYWTKDGTWDEEFETEQEAYQDCVETNNLNYDYIEAYEFWIVSDWLADQLQAKGELITKDFLGLTIWGRTCSGQAIYCDRVIQEITDTVYMVDEIINEILAEERKGKK